MTSNHPNKDRLELLSSVRKEIEKNVPTDKEELLKHIANTEDFQTANEVENAYLHLDPNIVNSIRNAIIRKRVSEVMFAIDKHLPEDAKETIIQRQKNAYFEYKIGDKKLKGHAESIHGAEPPEDFKNYCLDNNINSFEEETEEICANVKNHILSKKSRLFTDVNKLTNEENDTGHLITEGQRITKQYNTNAIKAQRDTLKQVLQESDNLDKNGKCKNPYLAVYVHGKADNKTSANLVIGAKQRNGKGPIDPRLAYWVKKELSMLLQSHNVRNKEGQIPSIDIVTYEGKYSGSPALTKLRHGDKMFDFQGFGENLQALQLECGRFLRDNHKHELSLIINELIEKFTETFKTTEDFNQIQQYQEDYEAKRTHEKENLFNKEKILFSENYAENVIGLAEQLREELNVKKGDFIHIQGIDKPLKVIGMLLADLSNHKMKLNIKYESIIQNKLEINIKTSQKPNKTEATSNQENKESEHNDKILFTSDYGENLIGLSETLRKKLGIEQGQIIRIKGINTELKVLGMKKEDLSKGKIKLNAKYKDLITKIELDTGNETIEPVNTPEPTNNKEKTIEKEITVKNSKIKYSNEYSRQVIGMTNAMRNKLGVKEDEFVTIQGIDQPLEVIAIPFCDETELSIKLDYRHQNSIPENPVITKNSK